MLSYVILSYVVANVQVKSIPQFSPPNAQISTSTGIGTPSSHSSK